MLPTRSRSSSLLGHLALPQTLISFQRPLYCSPYFDIFAIGHVNGVTAYAATELGIAEKLQQCDVSHFECVGNIFSQEETL